MTFIVGDSAVDYSANYAAATTTTEEDAGKHVLASSGDVILH